ncbi:MAG: hypothetical protein AAF126_07310, partial [Chloroflexota bacterium]
MTNFRPVFRFGLILSILMLVFVLPLSAQDTGATDPTDLPLLEPGFHLGTTFYGGNEIPEDEVLIDQVEFAAQEGMSAFALYVDWVELEPEPGNYTFDNLEASLNWLHSMGIQPLLNLTLIDIGDVNLPDHVVLDDLQFSERLHQLLDRVVPLLLDNGGFLLLLGNEVDVYFEEASDAELANYVQLIAEARDHVSSLDPDLAVGVTLTGTEVYAQGLTFRALRPVTDIIPFNYYGISTDWTDWLTVLDEDAIRADLDEYARIYDGDPMVIQEIGCPSAETNESSLEIQAACFDVMFDALQMYPNVRYVTVFTMFDFDEPTCDLVVDFFTLSEDDLPQSWLDRWRGYLCTLGM